MDKDVGAREVSPLEAKKLLDSGFSYLDVRTSVEFESGHPQGAINVPFLLQLGAGAGPSPDFVPAVEGTFALTQGLIVGCATGVRSRAAAALLRERGFSNVLEMPAGFDGRRGAFGAVLERGWRACGLPISGG